MEQKTLATLAVGVTGALLIAARRIRNKDEDSGSGIAFCVMLILVNIWL